MSRAKCTVCQTNYAEPGWDTCTSCDTELEQTDIEDEEWSFKTWAEKDYAEQEELKFLDDMLFGGR